MDNSPSSDPQGGKRPDPQPNLPPLIVDAHEDLAWNMLVLGRDYTRSAAETRRRDRDTDNATRFDDTLLGWPDYQRGRVAVVFSTLFVSPRRKINPDWDASHSYLTDDQAYQLYLAQLDAYHRLTDDHPDRFRLLESRQDLDEILEKWRTTTPPPAPPQIDADKEHRGTFGEGEESTPPPGAPVGLCVLMEGAEGVRAPRELEEWWQRGVRLIGPAWAGNRYCGGTGEPGPLTPEGYALLEAMASLGFGLDLSHMDVKSALQALDAYPGTILASHANAARLLKNLDSNRHLPDEVIQGLIERGGVIGVVPYNRFLQPGWSKNDPRSAVSLQHVAAHIDAICQMAGDARHVGIGTDFDGGFGVQSVPAELDTIADLHKLEPLLAEKGYSAADIAAILGQNWLNLLKRML